jgi:hypothetical protein
MKKVWKWLFGTRTKQCNIHDVSESYSMGYTQFFDYNIDIEKEISEPFRNPRIEIHNTKTGKLLKSKGEIL